MSYQRYDIPEDLPDSVNRRNARLMYMTAATYSGDWVSELHTHTYSELFYVVGGTGQFHIVDKYLTVSTDDLVIVNPKVEHREIGINGKSLEYIVLGIDGLEFGFGEDEDDRYSIVNLHSGGSELRYFLKIMLKEMQAQEDGYSIVCHDLLEVLLLRLMRRVNVAITPAQFKSRASNECATVRRYIDAHFKENLNLDQLAQLTHLNKYYMVHSFSQEYGSSPINYQISKRIQEGQYLLRTTDHPISRIATILGFSSPSYFTQSFRKITGVSPAEYRRQQHLAKDKKADTP